MIKHIMKGTCKVVKQDTYMVVVDDAENLTIITNNTDNHVSVVLDKGDAMKLANSIIDCYNGKGEYENV